MIKTLRLLALLEGISTLILFGIAMPLKYIWHQETIMFPVGLAHGVLFLLYCSFVVVVAWKMKWTYKLTCIALVASLVPGGTFYADYKYFKNS